MNKKGYNNAIYGCMLSIPLAVEVLSTNHWQNQSRFSPLPQTKF